MKAIEFDYITERGICYEDDSVSVVFNLNNVTFKLLNNKLILNLDNDTLELADSDFDDYTIAECYSDLVTAINNMKNKNNSSEGDSDNLIKETITKTYSSNGSYTIVPSDENHIIEQVNVSVNVAQTQAPINIGRKIYRFRPSQSSLQEYTATYNDGGFRCTVPTSVGDWVFVATDDNTLDTTTYSNTFTCIHIVSAQAFEVHLYCPFTDGTHTGILDLDY